MTRGKAIEAAGRAAEAVWQAARGGKPSSFVTNLNDDIGHKQLAAWIDANPDAPAEAVYIFGTDGRAGRTPWTQVPAALRVAIEVFRATYLILLVEMRAALAARPVQEEPPAPLPDRGMTRRAFRQKPGFGGRVDFNQKR